MQDTLPFGSVVACVEGGWHGYPPISAAVMNVTEIHGRTEQKRLNAPPPRQTAAASRSDTPSLGSSRDRGRRHGLNPACQERGFRRHS